MPLLNQWPYTEAGHHAIHQFGLFQLKRYLAPCHPKSKKQASRKQLKKQYDHGKRCHIPVPVITNKKRKLVQIHAEDLAPPLKKRGLTCLVGQQKRKPKPTPAKKPALTKKGSSPPPTSEKRKSKEINADEPADRNRHRYFGLGSPLSTIPEEEEEILEGTGDEEVQSEDTLVSPATTVQQQNHQSICKKKKPKSNQRMHQF